MRKVSYFRFEIMEKITGTTVLQVVVYLLLPTHYPAGDTVDTEEVVSTVVVLDET